MCYECWCWWAAVFRLQGVLFAKICIPHTSAESRMDQLAKICTGDHRGADCKNMRSAKIILSPYARVDCVCRLPPGIYNSERGSPWHFVTSGQSTLSVSGRQITANTGQLQSVPNNYYQVFQVTVPTLTYLGQRAAAAIDGRRLAVLRCAA